MRRLRQNLLLVLLGVLLLGWQARPAPSEAARVDEVPTTRVPALLGRDLVDARRFAISHGLLPSIRFVDGSASRLWTVQAQDRVAGTPVLAGSVLELEVLRAPATQSETRVPGLWGLTEASALEALQAVGLEGRLVRESSRLEAGRVTGASFEPGSRLRRGTAVELRIAATPTLEAPAKRVIVPRLVGGKGFQAFGTLIQAGLVPGWRWREAVKERPGIVFEQTPAAGSEVDAGSTVLFVEPALSEVPEVVGLTRAQAASALHAAHLLASPDGAASPHGVVTSSEPAAGAEINRGGAVLLRLAPSTSVPEPLEPAPIEPLPSAPDDAWPPADGEPTTPAPSTWPPEESGPGAPEPPAEVPPAPTPPPPPRPLPRPAPPRTAPREPRRAPGASGAAAPLTPLPPESLRRLLSPGAFYVRVPDLRGLTWRRAGEAARSAGLIVRSTTGSDGVVREDDVVSGQTPAAGTSVLRRSGLALTTRPPPGTVVMPDLRGRRVDIALRTLSANGLRGRVVAGSGGGDGVVNVHNPGAGSRTTVGTEVVLYDHGRPASSTDVRIPAVRALRTVVAARTLTALGLRVTVEGPSARADTLSLATTTIPAEGTLVPRGTTVRLVTTNVPR
jgi:beta-lactam-binding protein with PASTA domain